MYVVQFTHSFYGTAPSYMIHRGEDIGYFKDKWFVVAIWKIKPKPVNIHGIQTGYY
jgi:hypothetical protein